MDKLQLNTSYRFGEIDSCHKSQFVFLLNK